MTTDQKDVSASAEQQQAQDVSAEEQAIADQISQAAEGTEAQQQEAVEQVAEKTGLSIEDVKKLLKEEFDGFTGRQNNWNAQQVRQIREELKKEMEQSLQPVSQFISQFEQARVEQLSPEEQVEYWKARATQPAATVQQPAQQPSEMALSEQDKNALSLAVSSMLDGKGMDSNLLSDARLWEGGNASMSVSELYQVARRNADKLAAKPAAAKPAAPARSTPAPSASGAPRKSSTQIRTRSEVNELLIDGKINSDQARRMLSELTSKGATSY